MRLVYLTPKLKIFPICHVLAITVKGSRAAHTSVSLAPDPAALASNPAATRACLIASQRPDSEVAAHLAAGHTTPTATS